MDYRLEAADLQMGRREQVMHNHQLDRKNQTAWSEYTWLIQELLSEHSTPRREYRDCISHCYKSKR